MSIEIQQRRVEMLFDHLMNHVNGKMLRYESLVENQRRSFGAWRNRQHLNFLKEVVRERNSLIGQAGNYRETELREMEQDLILALTEAGYFREHPEVYDELMNATESVQRGLFVEFKEALKQEGYRILLENEGAVQEVRRLYLQRDRELWEQAKAGMEEYLRLEANYASAVNEVVSGNLLPDEHNERNEELKERRAEINALKQSIPVLKALPRDAHRRPVEELMNDERVREAADKVFIEILEANTKVREALMSGKIEAYKISSLVGKVLANKQYSDYELQMIGEEIAKEKRVDEIISITLAVLGITLAVASFFVGGTLVGIALKAGMAIGGTAIGLIDAGRELAQAQEQKKLVYAGLYGEQLTDEGLHEVDVGLMASILLFGVELFSILDAVDAFRALNKVKQLADPAKQAALAAMPNRVELLNELEVDDLKRITGDGDGVSVRVIHADDVPASRVNPIQSAEVSRIRNPEIELVNVEHPHNYTMKGNYGEMKTDIDLEGTNRYQRMNDDRVTSLNAPMHHGIDGIYRNANPVVSTKQREDG